MIAATGIYTYDHLPQYFVNRTVEQMAAHFVDDIREGIQGTGIKAAFLKCAADEPGVNENVEKVHRAVAQAHRETGAPIIAHSRPASQTGPRQVEIFEEEGVDLSRVVIAHCGDTDDVDYIEGLLAKGVYVGLDRFGLNMFLPTAQRNPTAAELLRRGHAERLHFSQDFCCTIDYFPPEARRGDRGVRRARQLVADDDLRPRVPVPARAGRVRRRRREDGARRQPAPLADRAREVASHSARPWSRALALVALGATIALAFNRGAAHSCPAHHIQILRRPAACESSSTSATQSAASGRSCCAPTAMASSSARS